MRRIFWIGLGVLASTGAACAATGDADDAGSSDDGSIAADAADASSPTDTGAKDVTTCVAPKIACADAGCVDTTNDPEHCGACGTACVTGDASSLAIGSNDNPDSGIPKPVDAGQPWSLGTATCSASACGVQCPTGLTRCSDGICYDTQQFHENCGVCGYACAAGEYCGSGHCCASGKAYCGSACVDVLSNDSNCGSCGVACTGSDVCLGGACITCSGANEALGATATSSGGGQTDAGFGPEKANDNLLEINGCPNYNWLDTNNNPTTSWLQYTWPTAQTLTKIHIDTVSSSNDPCTSFGGTVSGAQVQWWNGSTWVTDGTVSNKSDDWDYTFTAPVVTTQLRLYAVQAPVGRVAFIWELQAFGCN
ncbi:MAG TPA: hypothetical protein VGH28_19255 [Polyangiaceae bacterium]